MRALLLAVGGVAALSWAQAPAATPLRLVVGKPVVLDLMNQQTRCDDPSLVSVEVGPGDKGTQVTGLKPGKTQCSFGFAGGKGMRRLYDIEVVAAPKEPEKELKAAP